MAVTLTELLVVVACITVLLGLLIPAVMSGRESARRATCQNNLHQIGVAVGSFHSRSGRLPREKSGFLEMKSELELPLGELEDSDWVAGSLAALRCPSDYTIPVTSSPISYFPNAGSKLGIKNGSEAVLYTSGTYCPYEIFITGHETAIRYSDISDGLSRTALYSEHLQTVYHPPCHPSQMSWVSPRLFPPGQETQLRAYLNEAWAKRLLVRKEDTVYAGGTRIASGFYYDHLWSPNKPMAFAIEQPMLFGTFAFWVSPPSSAHANGVLVLMADGHVVFVHDDIDPSIWSAIGSRNGSEVVPDAF